MHKLKRIGSLLMALAMIVSLIPNVGAAEVYEDTGDDAYFDLNAEEYEFREDAGDQSIIVKRTGNLGVEVDVAFKVADFLTTYGTDYVVLDAAGKPLAKVDGVKPDVSDLTVEESDAGIIEEAPPSVEAAVEEPAPAEEPVATEPAAETPATTEEPVAETEPATEEPVAAEEPAPAETPATTEESVADEEAAVTTEDAATEEPAEVAEAVDEASEPDVAEEPATEDAAEVTEEAVEAADEPAEAVEEAVETVEEPAEVTEEPADVAEEPIEDTAEQVVEVETDNDASMAALSDETAVLSDAAAVDEPADEVADAVLSDAAAVDEPAEAAAANVKRAHSTGSPLRDAAYSYLNIDGEQAMLQGASVSETEREIEQLLTETNAYFQSAEGAEGVLHFDKGQTEQAIVVRPTNDEQSNGTRVFLVALMGVAEGQRGRVAPDANAYVSLIDDEDREAPAYSLA
ncbi:MAG: hypothetical protein IJT31_02195, partial [Oscillibacter sp.]|nr:hypothetical protein [Oscillibacter sp.]